MHRRLQLHHSLLTKMMKLQPGSFCFLRLKTMITSLGAQHLAGIPFLTTPLAAVLVDVVGPVREVAFVLDARPHARHHLARLQRPVGVLLPPLRPQRGV